MKRIKQLSIVFKYYQQLEQQAAMIFAKEKQKLSLMEEHLQQLKEYQHHYQYNMRDTHACQSSHLKNCHAFLDKLHQSITQQIVAIDSEAIQVMEKQQQWQQRKTKVQSIELVLNKLKAGHQATLSKREQKEVDQWVQNHQRS